MTIRQVLRMGEPLLLQKASAISQFDTTELHGLIQDMEDTMAAMNGAGIAAPQIGVSLRVVIFGQRNNTIENPRYADANEVPYTVLINPVLRFIGADFEANEELAALVADLIAEIRRLKTCLKVAGLEDN